MPNAPKLARRNFFAILSAFCDGTSRYGVPENLMTG